MDFLVDCGIQKIIATQWARQAKQGQSRASCFIGYSTKNRQFAEKLHADMRRQGVNCWFAPESMKIGDKVLDAIDRAIENSAKVVLVLSKEAIESGWVEDEVTRAFAIERKKRKSLLLPIRTDHAVLRSKKSWAKKLRDSRNIGDFTLWETDSGYQTNFCALLSALKEDIG